MAFDVENILDSSDIKNLFGDDEPQVETPQPEENEENDDDKKSKAAEDKKDISIGDLFGPESVGGEEDDDDKDKGSTSSGEDGSSPKTNFYSSIASALAEDGAFQYLDKEDIENVSDVEQFAELFNKEVQARLDDTQKRINEALTAGVEPTEVQRYENTMNYLNGITEDSIKDESENGEKLRKQLIYSDYLQKGMSEDRAKREVKKSFDAGTDIDDAMDALESCKQQVKSSYDNLLKQAKDESKKADEERKKTSEQLRKSMLESDTFIDGLKVDKTTRQKAYDAMNKPVHKDENGNMLTEVQKYQKENPVDFMKNVGMLYVLTDGFKKLDKLVGERVKKEKKNGLRQLESVINSTSRNADGSLKFASGSDPDSYLGKGGFRLDI